MTLHFFKKIACTVLSITLMLSCISFASAQTTDKDELDAKLSAIMSECDKNASTSTEKALWLHDYLINNTDYDLTYSNYDGGSAILTGSGTCQAYAEAYSLLLDKAGINNAYVSGYGNGGDHLWNLVELDGEWVHVDTTWDDPIGGKSRQKYFGKTSDEMAKDHEWSADGVIGCELDESTLSVNLTASASKIGVGASTTVKAVVSSPMLKSSQINQSVTYSTSNAKVAVVSSAGKVTGIAAGTAVITAVNSTGKSDSVTITVVITGNSNVEVESVKLNKSSAAIQQASTLTLKATVAPKKADKSVKWTTSNASVATVSSTGKVTAIKGGTAIITATAVNGTSASCTVTVASREVSSVKLSKSALALTTGKTSTLKASVAPSNAISKKATWSSSNSSVATVSSSGKVKAVGIGTAVITATSNNGVSSSCTVVVSPITLTKATIASSKSVKLGKTASLKVTFKPSNASDKSVTWTSSNESVATVSASGVVTGIAKGTAVITMTTANGITDTCKITVK
ncbi:MAG: Ig-like domain-containing protein [Eubacteriales bacterium]|nr:Ig-like domain-containing protein [Eubacteriales bacterium]MDD3882922.1 Ig-like domain-containing protein [Eubacteriales bacterium]MDD4513531.1 Ig-like domain-containing protein [Eubacteriales bacterium]